MGERLNSIIKEEYRGINIQNEGILHSQIKQWYAEEKIDLK